MARIYSEEELTWSSVERHYKYDRVTWSVRENGIPIYTLLDKNNKKIKVNNENCLVLI